MRISHTFSSRRSNVMATHGMVATSQPLAAEVGLDVLKRGGTAADAAVAMAAMLNVVEPIATGIGGDVFVLYYDAHDRRVYALNGSGRAANAASIEALRSRGYDQMPTYTGHTVTVPGAVAAWHDLIERFGRFSLSELLQPAIQTAEQGYPVSELIALGWKTQVKKLLRAPDWESPDVDSGPPQPSGNELLIYGRAPRPGEIIRLPTLARTLEGIARAGKAYIYEGPFAQKLCEHVRRYGGWLTPEDMASHRSTWESPITAQYRDVTLYECGPNGQGLVAILALNILDGFDWTQMSSIDRVHVFIEAMRLAFADALCWVADPEHVRIPLDTLLSSAYSRKRREQISLQKANMEVTPGVPCRLGKETAYLTVVDGEGNACSFINSLYMGTGTGLVVPGTGVALQNRGALFSLDEKHPNALAPRKRPYHTIIPAMVTKDDALYASFGVMGGFMQPQGHVQILANMVDLDMSPQMALDMPRWMLAPPEGMTTPEAFGQRLYIEHGWDFESLAELAQRGHHLAPVTGRARAMFGGGQVILRLPSGVLVGGSDPRKDGCALGF